jgi:hypothetical protein
MTDKDRTEFALCVAALAEAFGRQSSKATQFGYWLGLQDLPLSSVQAATAKALRQCKFMPAPSELRELAGESTEDERAVLAWDRVVFAVQRLGPYRHVSFEDVLANGVIRNLGGWVTFTARFTDAESEKWARKEFLDTYKTLSNAKVDSEECRPLAGLSTGRVVMIDGERVVRAPLVHAVGQSVVRLVDMTEAEERPRALVRKP